MLAASLWAGTTIETFTFRSWSAVARAALGGDLEQGSEHSQTVPEEPIEKTRRQRDRARDAGWREEEHVRRVGRAPSASERRDGGYDEGHRGAHVDPTLGRRLATDSADEAADDAELDRRDRKAHEESEGDRARRLRVAEIRQDGPYDPADASLVEPRDARDDGDPQEDDRGAEAERDRAQRYNEA